MNNSNFTIITFYQFKRINDPAILKEELKKFCSFNKMRGTTIIAKEGINGTLAGLKDSIKIFVSLMSNKGFTNLELKYSYYKFMPFNRLKIKFKKEIVTFGLKYLDPEHKTGKHINVKDWNALIKGKDTLVIDVRNDFEFTLGTFQDAVNPHTKDFTEFKKYVDRELNNYKQKKIAMFCTGGIRCEKATSYMISQGFKDVNQLKGGILKYLEEIPKNNSIWNGECFVFDNRVSVQNGLKEGTYELCHACRYPISSKQKKSNFYKKGLSCPNCYDKISLKKKKALIERNNQISISKRKGIYNPYIKFTPNDLY